MTATARRRVAVRLWPLVAVIAFALLVWDGLAYLLDPPAVPPARPGQVPNDPWLVLREVPGGLRTHGVVLLVCALLVLLVLASRVDGHGMQVALIPVAVYGCWAAYCMAGAWASMPDPIWTSPSKWAVLGALTLALVVSPRYLRSGPPPPERPREVDGA